MTECCECIFVVITVFLLNNVCSSVDEAEWLNQIDSVCEGFDQQADEPDGDADIG